MRKGLDTKTIIQIAIQMIEQDGWNEFSLHKLADHLGIKTASLYNHVKNYEDLMTQISVEVIHLLIQNLKNAIQDQKGDQRIFALAQAYYQFGMSHHELYQIFMQSRGHNQTLEQEGIHILDPIMDSFSDFHLSKEEKIHWERILRSIVHGFISQEKAGFFTFQHISSEKSFKKAIGCVIDGMHQAERRNGYES